MPKTRLAAAPLLLASVLAACTGPLVPSTDTDGNPGSTSDATGTSSSTSSLPPATTDSTSPLPTTIGSSDTFPSTDPTTSDTHDTLDSSSDGSTGGAVFIPLPETDQEPDGCDAFGQDCPVGEKCTYWAFDGGDYLNSTRCVPVAPDPVGPGAGCTVEGHLTGFDDCDADSYCWSIDPESDDGRCYSFCTGSEHNPTCEAADDTCVLPGDGIPALCFPDCGPLDQDCAPEESCALWDASFVCLPTPSGTGGYLSPCDSIASCDSGLLCVMAELLSGCSADACCTHYCDLTAPDCPDPTTCAAFYPDGQAPPGYENVGVCIEEG